MEDQDSTTIQHSPDGGAAPHATVPQAEPVAGVAQGNLHGLEQGADAAVHGGGNAMIEVATENPYGLMAALEQGGIIAQAVFGIMVIMSLVSWYIIIVKAVEQSAILREARTLGASFWKASSIAQGASSLAENSAFRQIADDGMQAFAHHEGRLTDKIDRNEWVTAALNRSVNAVGSKMSNGLPFLASVGSTAPFIGLFGTVVGIYRALINIGIAGQASIDKVAGPVGEALIMTALGLAVAVPAVLGYNWLLRRNKEIMETAGNFASDIHAVLFSGERMESSGRK